jgi:hypothetical protein
MMAKRWVFSLLTVTIMLGLIGLLTFTGESVHHPAEPGRPLTYAPRSRVTPPVEPEMGPVLQGNGLMLTY